MEQNEKPKRRQAKKALPTEQEGRNKGGRPEWVFDARKAKKFVELCEADANIEELCAYFDVDAKTLKKHVAKYYNKLKGEELEDEAGFSAIFEQKKKLFNLALKVSTMKKVKKGDSAVIIYLRKVKFGETEKTAVSADFTVNYVDSQRPDFTQE